MISDPFTWRIVVLVAVVIVLGLALRWLAEFPARRRARAACVARRTAALAELRAHGVHIDETFRLRLREVLIAQAEEARR